MEDMETRNPKKTGEFATGGGGRGFGAVGL